MDVQKSFANVAMQPVCEKYTAVVVVPLSTRNILNLAALSQMVKKKSKCYKKSKSLFASLDF